MRAPSIHDLCLSGNLPDTVQEALCAFLEVSLDPSNEGDRMMVSSICTFWMECFRTGRLQTGRSIKLWLRYVDTNNLLNIIDQACDVSNAALTLSVLGVLEFALDTLKSSFTCTSSRIPISQLLKLHRTLPDSQVLEGMIAVAVNSHLPPYHDGQPLRAKTLDFSLSLRPLPTSGNLQLDILPADFVSTLFRRATWTESTARIVSGLVYTQQT
ncbi:hypothetical protein DFH29DRAFT_1081076 [Suillus ampliporus]|nr:hypothetical protein DFH29DRAFT_1081076 [Suillus ampliporus]